MIRYINRIGVLVIIACCIGALSISFKSQQTPYSKLYYEALSNFENELLELWMESEHASPDELINDIIPQARMAMKKVDIWLRYLEPTLYKKINAPLPVEWETEVFEKWERPYKRVGGGLSLLEMYVFGSKSKDSVVAMLSVARTAMNAYHQDSITRFLNTPDHFILANRLHLLNLATIYTTGFECPNKDLIIPELLEMMRYQMDIYEAFNKSFPNQAYTHNYITNYGRAIAFVESQAPDPLQFDHYKFIHEFVNPLFALNQIHIRKHRAISKSFNDYSLNDEATSIFDKTLYKGQSNRGVFKGLRNLNDQKTLIQIGEKLFHDPIMSANNKRSCASCHKADQCFTDQLKSSTHFNGTDPLERNTPSLVNALANHLLMLDGRHTTPLEQAEDVVQNPMEMGHNQDEIFEKICDVPYYRKELRTLAKKTIYDELSIKHVYSAIIAYYSQFDDAISPFDKAMNNYDYIYTSDSIKKGFNLFMSKAECGTCHFAPYFNGVKPPYIGSEFEVLGTPFDSTNTSLSTDTGRAGPHPVAEMHSAFRTPSLRNLACTAPYMHNGTYHNLDQVIEFYNKGGGQGLGFDVPNQTLNSDELHLTPVEISFLKAFLNSLNEELNIPEKEVILPEGKKELKIRPSGGTY
ncbi:MAG: cytochrome C peroxidase [Bacteroidia bacterium]